MNLTPSVILAASLVALAGWALPGPTAADEIMLENGSRIVGTVTGLAGEDLTIASDYAKPIMIKKDKVTRITTDAPLELHLNNGEVLKGRLRTGNDGRFLVDREPGREAIGIDWREVAAINPPPVKQWQGSVGLAGNYQTGNTDRSALSFGAEAVRRGERDRFGIRLLYGIAEEDSVMTSRSAFGALKYDYFFTKNFYGYLGVELLNDKFKDLNLRAVVGPGVGYQLWDDPVKALGLEAGIAYFSEDLRQGEDKRWLTARLAGNLMYRFSSLLVFTDQLVLYPSLESFSDFKLRNEAALATALGSGWSLKLANILDYDNHPPAGVKKTDSNFIVGLQYAF